MDVKRAAELYAQGRTLSQIGAELGVQSNIVHDHLRRAGVTMRPVGAPTHPASTQEILYLRDKGLTWTEVAKRVDMTVSGAWSRYRNARPPSRRAWTDGSRFSKRRLTKTSRSVFEPPSLIISAAPPPELS